MISIETFHSNEGILGFQISGHAGWAEAGYDIVCAAVSVLAQSTVLGIDSVIGFPVDASFESGFAHVRVQPNGSEDNRWENVQVLLETALLAFQEIHEQYPKRVQIRKSRR